MAIGGWWEEQVVARLVRCGCGAEAMMELRGEIIPLAAGDVFELGCGAGSNQPLYDRARVRSFRAVEPSPRLRGMARAAAAANGWGEGCAVAIGDGVGEALPFADASFDTVVCTFTMCSVTDHAGCLAELRRVLKPGGRFLYAEHGRAPDPGVARWQRRIDPVWRRLMGNCHLSRPIRAAMEAAGFVVTPVAERYRQGPRVFSWMEWGSAASPG